ncbi:acetyl xylan esterase [Cronobacter dublinensis]|nr:acetyl xylan esterase [Cronobacter dublinensis]EKF2290661.1 acetyl xylan esterase [Cronobacter dublinensis]EKF2295594.1 acetyl xylan esterase [Cronobacter dublinensis]EKK5268116.1 acetyl xylan esterase [Cronobacter dublinensis]EKM0138994.1 acetyl xylan esterase [Cronobacter dublinensis]
MQVHDQTQGLPALALAGDSESVKRMQNHSPYGCMAYIVKNSAIYEAFLTGYGATSSSRRRV